MPLTGVAVVFVTSLMALPVSYTMNAISGLHNQWVILLVGCFVFPIVLSLPYFILRKTMHNPDPFFYVLSILAFRSVIGLIIALENDSLIAEFMGIYIRKVEPYFKTAHCTIVAYLDGVGHYGLYLMMLAALSWNQSFCDVGLIWVGSFCYSNFVLTVSVMIGQDHVSWPFLIHLPYMLLCLWSAVRFIKEKNQEAQDIKNQITSENVTIIYPIWKRPIDLLLAVCLLLAAGFTIFRYSASMGGNILGVKFYSAKIEPYLSDGLPYVKMQQTIQLFYFVPYYLMSVCSLTKPGHGWIYTWSLLFAGAAVQAQLSFMGASLHYRTPYIHRVPQNSLARSVFWTANSVMLLLPQLVALRVQNKPEFFLSDESTSTTSDTAASNGNVTSQQNVEKKND